MKDVVVKITGKTLSSIPKPPDDSVDEPIEFITEGKMMSRGNITQISYEETQLSGTEGCTTSITLTPNKMKMKRFGGDLPEETVMEFEKGKRYNGRYETPYGPIDMEILTSKVSDLMQIDDDSKKCSIEYAISLKGFLEARKAIDIEIHEKH